MTRFGRAISHLKSTQIDEKIKFLNKELKKTGVVCEDAPANSTANLYYSSQEVAATPEETSPVPDSTGWYEGGTQDDNGGDTSNPTTWDTGWNNVDDMLNGNDVGGEVDRPIPITPDLSGWNGGYVSANSAVIFGGSRPEGDTQPTSATGIAFYSGDQGQSCIGSLGGGNKFVQILVGDAVFGSYAYPGLPKSPGYYSAYTDDEFDAARNLAAAYEANKTKGTVTRKAWVPFDTANNGVPYASYTGAKKTTITYTAGSPDGSPTYWALKDVNILAASNTYVSRPAVAAYDVITRDSLDDGEFYPGNPGGFMDFLRGILDVGEKALDWLLDNATPQAQIRNAIDAFTDLHPELRYAKDIADSVLSGAPVNYTPTQGEIDALADNFDVASIGQTTEINSEPQNYSDDNFYVDDNNDVHQHDADSILDHPNNTSSSSGGSAFANPLGAAGQAQYQIVVPDDGSEPYLRYTDYAYHNLDSLDAGEVQGPAEILANMVNAVANEIFNRNDGDPNTGAMSDYNSGIRGVRITGPIDIPISQLGTTSTGSSVLDVLYYNGWDLRNENYEPQGELIKEGWESPKHTYIDKDQQKRWFKEKDVAPVYPKDPPPEMIRGYHPKLLPKSQHSIPFIKVTKKDLIRSHKLTKDEAKEMIQLVDRLNEFIKNNPDKLAYARERYPKDDVRLAELNFKLDMQLAAADDYLETQFPENKRRLKLIQRAVKKSTELTDPKTYKKKSKYLPFEDTGILRTVNDLETYGAPTRKRKTRKKNKWIQKPKKKTSEDMMNEKMIQLEMDMKKTIPD